MDRESTGPASQKLWKKGGLDGTFRDLALLVLAPTNRASIRSKGNSRAAGLTDARFGLHVHSTTTLFSRPHSACPFPFFSTFPNHAAPLLQYAIPPFSSWLSLPKRSASLPDVL